MAWKHTVIPPDAGAIELAAKHHGSPADVGSVLVYRLPKGELRNDPCQQLWLDPGLAAAAGERTLLYLTMGAHA